MKKLILFLFLSFQAHAYQVVLNFDTESEAKEWTVWYLDGGGEQSSKYLATDWFEIGDTFVLNLERESNQNERTK